MSLRHGERETFLHTERWDEFWLSNGGLDDLQAPSPPIWRTSSPDVVHFHHVIGLGVEAIALVRRALPEARLVITFHEYLPICPNHGQMVKAGAQRALPWSVAGRPATPASRSTARPSCSGASST